LYQIIKSGTVPENPQPVPAAGGYYEETGSSQIGLYQIIKSGTVPENPREL
jgi:hypothetical protein